MYADDQFVNQEQISIYFKEIGIFNKLLLFSDGKEVSDYFETLLDGFIDGNSEG